MREDEGPRRSRRVAAAYAAAAGWRYGGDAYFGARCMIEARWQPEASGRREERECTGGLRRANGRGLPTQPQVGSLRRRE